jgi:hypothetical protein
MARAHKRRETPLFEQVEHEGEDRRQRREEEDDPNAQGAEPNQLFVDAERGISLGWQPKGQRRENRERDPEGPAQESKRAANAALSETPRAAHKEKHHEGSDDGVEGEQPNRQRFRCQ